MIPKLVKLKELATQITKGTTPTSIGLSFSDGGIPFIRVQNLQHGELSLNGDTLFISQDTHQSLTRSQIQPLDVLLSIAGTIGRAAMVPNSAPPLNCNQAVAIIRPSKLIKPKYLVWWLLSQDAQRQMSGAKVTATISNLSLTQIGELLVPLPSLAEQERIIQLLDKAQDVIAIRKRSAQLLNDLSSGLFVQCFGDPATNPNRFPEATLVDVTTKITDGEHQTPVRAAEGFKLLSARNIQNGYLNYAAGVDYVPEVEYQRIRKRCDPEMGDILLSCSGTIGRVTAVRTTEPFVLVRSVALLKLKAAKVRPTYLEAFLRTPYMQALIARRAKQSSQANLFTGEIKQLPILIPPLSLQDRFTDLDDKLRVIREKQICSAQYLGDLFDSLLSEAFPTPQMNLRREA